MKFAMHVQYDGSFFYGFQKQSARSNQPTIQAALEYAISNCLGQPTQVEGAGRTDRGVHARGQVVSFAAENVKIPAEGLKRRLNAILPLSIRVNRVWQVGDDFHARFSARSRTYWYLIRLSERERVWENNYVWKVGKDVDIEILKETLKLFVGEHDFTAFSANLEPGQERRRKILSVGLKRLALKGLFGIRFVGESFLPRMVRYLVSVGVATARGEIELTEVLEMLEKGRRTREIKAAPPGGLYLTRVSYF